MNSQLEFSVVSQQFAHYRILLQTESEATLYLNTLPDFHFRNIILPLLIIVIDY